MLWINVLPERYCALLTSVLIEELASWARILNKGLAPWARVLIERPCAPWDIVSWPRGWRRGLVL